MFTLTTDINNAANAIRSLVSDTRSQILAGERNAHGHVIIKLSEHWSLSVVNNSHAYSDEWEGAAIMECAFLHNHKFKAVEGDNKL